MKRLLALYDSIGWAYWNRCEALKKYAPSGWRVETAASGDDWDASEFDCVLSLEHFHAGRTRSRLTGSKARFVASLNLGPGDQHAPSLFRACVESADVTIINSRLMWEHLGRHPKTVPISNGVDGGIFRPLEPVEKRPLRVLWCGSSNPKKGKGYADILLPLAERLEAHGIECDFRPRNDLGEPGLMDREAMCRWYNTGSVLVVASLHEGTPNIALEAASCGCVVVSTPVGNMPELIRHGENGLLCERSVSALERAVLYAVRNRRRLSESMLKDIKPWHWKNRGGQFFDLFERLCSSS